MAIATDVIMHCESATTPASQIQATLIRLYKGQPIDEIGTATAGKQDKVAGAGMKTAVSTPAAAFGNQGD